MRRPLLAVLVTACASAPPTPREPAPRSAPATGEPPRLVTVRVELESPTDTLPMFELASRNRGCTVQRASDKGMRALVMQCPDGTLIAAQQGTQLLLACSASEFTAARCGTYAAELLEHVAEPTGGVGSPGFGPEVPDGQPGFGTRPRPTPLPDLPDAPPGEPAPPSDGRPGFGPPPPD